MRRPSREINTFSISMLDVISSALGAILILFLITLQAQSKAEASSKDWQEKYQQLEEAIQKEQRRVAALQRDKAKLQRDRAKLRQEARAAAEASKLGQAIGMCTVNASSVTLIAWDHQAEDGDRVSMKVGATVVVADLSLKNAKSTLGPVALSLGVTYLIVESLDGGDNPPNTAAVTVDPCHGTDPATFEWEMAEVGQKSVVSIVRR